MMKARVKNLFMSGRLPKRPRRRSRPRAHVATREGSAKVSSPKGTRSKGQKGLEEALAGERRLPTRPTRTVSELYFSGAPLSTHRAARAPCPVETRPRLI